MSDEETLSLAILDAREQRAEHQQELIKKYKMTLVSARVNYPGIYKDNDITRLIMKTMSEEIYSSFEGAAAYKSLENSIEGPYLILIVDVESLEAKKITVEIENSHPLGRLVDIDVFNSEGIALSREKLGLDLRKCFLCGDAAHNCTRNRKHSINEIIQYIENQFFKYIRNK